MLTTTQVAVTTTVETLATLPGGECMVQITSDSASADEAYWGVLPADGVDITAATGVPLPVGQVQWFKTFPTFQGGTLQVICGTGTAKVGVVVSSYN